GQRLDDTGLYYYGARYYDVEIGRFISADTIVPDYTNPQALNRYSYVLNNPLKYTDPSGHQEEDYYWDDYYWDYYYWDHYWYEEMYEPSLPIESDSSDTDTYTVVWGYEASGGIIYEYYEATAVVQSGEGDYYRVETTGHGIVTGASVSLDIIEPGIEIEVQETLGAEASVTLVGMFDFEPSAKIRRDVAGWATDTDDTAYLAFSTPSVSLRVTKTNVKQISVNAIYADIPRWVRRAYERRGITW
ncbi:RHS repeat-associated core domain-containing protein, partial [Chloroflexota bacterium]